MPNWCSNAVMIKGNPEDIATVKAKIAKGGNSFSFDAIKPMPVGLRNTTAPAVHNESKQKVEFNKKNYGAVDWYDWANNNWGTKWDSSDTEMTIDNEEMIGYSFNTAWAPPIPVYEELAKLFPNTNIFANFDEPGVNFSGWKYYTEGEESDSRDYDASYSNIRTFMEPDSDVWEWLE